LSALFSTAGLLAGLGARAGAADWPRLALDGCFDAGFLAELFLVLFLVLFVVVFFALARLAAEADAPDFVRVGFLGAR